MRWLLGTWVCIAIAIAVTVGLLPGISIDWHPFAFAGLAAVWGLVNVSLGTLLRIVSAPIMLLTLGLFSVVVNTVVLALVAQVSDSLAVDGIWDAVLASIVISVVNAALMALWHRRQDRDDVASGVQPITPLG